jgi:hypothetical protein
MSVTELQRLSSAQISGIKPGASIKTPGDMDFSNLVDEESGNIYRLSQTAGQGLPGAGLAQAFSAGNVGMLLGLQETKTDDFKTTPADKSGLLGSDGSDSPDMLGLDFAARGAI